VGLVNRWKGGSNDVQCTIVEGKPAFYLQLMWGASDGTPSFGQVRRMLWVRKGGGGDEGGGEGW
jgi:hypothetical protein